MIRSPWLLRPRLPLLLPGDGARWRDAWTAVARRHGALRARLAPAPYRGRRFWQVPMGVESWEPYVIMCCMYDQYRYMINIYMYMYIYGVIYTSYIIVLSHLQM